MIFSLPEQDEGSIEVDLVSSKCRLLHLVTGLVESSGVISAHESISIDVTLVVASPVVMSSVSIPSGPPAEIAVIGPSSLTIGQSVVTVMAVGIGGHEKQGWSARFMYLYIHIFVYGCVSVVSDGDSGNRFLYFVRLLASPAF